MREILSDLVAEEQSLDQFLQGLARARLETANHGSRLVDPRHHQPPGFTEWAAAESAGGNPPGQVTSTTSTSGPHRASSRAAPSVIRKSSNGGAPVERLSSMPSPRGCQRRIDWILAPMSAKAFATLRLMETWAHGLDIKMALADRFTGEPEDDPLNDSPRLRHVAWLAHRMLPYSFEVAGEEFPEGGIRVELMGPNYARWVYGPPDAENVIKGIAGEWCRVAVHRLDVVRNQPQG